MVLELAQLLSELVQNWCQRWRRVGARVGDSGTTSSTNSGTDSALAATNSSPELVPQSLLEWVPLSWQGSPWARIKAQKKETKDRWSWAWAESVGVSPANGWGGGFGCRQATATSARRCAGSERLGDGPWSMQGKSTPPSPFSACWLPDREMDNAKCQLENLQIRGKTKLNKSVGSPNVIHVLYAHTLYYIIYVYTRTLCITTKLKFDCFVAVKMTENAHF